MKYVIFLSLLGMIGISNLQAQNADKSAISKVIAEFAKAGDENNVDKLEKCLDANYRVVMNQLFGSSEVAVVPRSVYISKIKSKEWGGDKRIVEIENISVNSKTAMAKVVFKGSKMTFVSLMTLVKDANGNWKLMSDVPVITS
ncbi:MAG: nuclear transport factor 2 family protein [Bacteroidota bacterium]